ncbi:MAG: amidase [Saprospiraceae bacterium]|nr:amidase [Saprospiraceae bacterium]
MVPKFIIAVVFLFLNISLAFSQDSLHHAAGLIGLEFNDIEIDSMLPGLAERRKDYESIRKVDLPNYIPPALHFNPLPVGFYPEQTQNPIIWHLPNEITLPSNKADLAFFSIGQLAALIKSKRISSTELTQFFLDRLKRFGDTLQAVVTITEQLALDQARRADQEIANGIYRGPLHGIPYGAKDLLSMPGYKTTWGAMPYKDQILSDTATVIRKLEESGAVLIAKLTLGALAWGDVWYGGITKNPWDLEQGSSGSSAGSASATVAGLVPFAIGTETWGSIVSPSTRCGATGLRPTFGRVSRAGAMALSWSMDKIGPICRSADDCALVFEAIHGSDGKDYTVIDAAFNYESDIDITKLKVGFFENEFDRSEYNRRNDSTTLDLLRRMGIELHPVTFDIKTPINALNFILSAEAAAAFDDLTRSGADDKMVRQIRRAWPNVFREARFIPAVEYIQANRIRNQLIEEMHTVMQEYDVILTPSFGPQLLATNLTGHPCVTVPNGLIEGHPASISFLGNLFDEAKILALAGAFQSATDHEDRHPPFFK